MNVEALEEEISGLGDVDSLNKRKEELGVLIKANKAKLNAFKVRCMPHSER